MRARRSVEIAHQLDYANAANFARAFHRLSGVTPTQFRHGIRLRSSPKCDAKKDNYRPFS